MEHPTPNSGERYGIADVFEYVEGALPDAVKDIDVGNGQEVVVTYDGDNRREVFAHLIKHGWAITSVDTVGRNTKVWLERLD